METTQIAISDALVREENNVQLPIYLVSRTLLDAETRYTVIEKTAYTVIIAARKLIPYFNALQVVVLTDSPLEKALK